MVTLTWCTGLWKLLRDGSPVKVTINQENMVMVPFTNERVVPNKMITILFGQRVLVAKEFKYLGVRLDDKLN